jgi:hypothetical protein
MELQNGMKVIAPAICNNYLTVGKSYEVYNVEPSTKYGATFEIINDIGTITNCLLKECKHLKGYDWILTSKQSLEEKLLKLAENTPNDMEFGLAVRKLLNN